MTQLSDEQIDQVSGRELDEAVARARGWERKDGYWYGPPFGDFAFNRPHEIHNDLGAAMGLLMDCKGVAVNITDTMVQVITGLTAADLIAMGPKEQAATVLCRAWLKIKNRGM